MFIVIKRKTIIYTLLITGFLSALGLSLYLWNRPTEPEPVFIDETLNRQITAELQKIFNSRNQAIIDHNPDVLENLYNTEVRNGLWAHEHELKRLSYVQSWSDKQGVKFTNIDSEIMLKSAKEKDNGYSIGALVVMEYKYVYEDDTESENSFRIGSNYSLDLMPYNGGWAITREWYTNPLYGTVSIDESKAEEIKQVILSGTAKDLSDLNERRVGAVAYADEFVGAASLPEYGFKYNPKYRNYNNQGGDCTNYASQVLFEGGGFKKNKTWNYDRGAGSKAWVNAHGFNSYMTSSGRGSVITRGSYANVLKNSFQLLPGDYIAYEEKGKVVHISVVTGLDSKGYPLVNSHNADRYRVPWDMGWNDKGVTFWLVRVHY